MHFFSAITVVLAATASCVSAVTIRNYRTGTCKGNYLQCSNVGALTCCDLQAQKVYSSSLFLGLPTTAVGSICRRNGQNSCGKVMKTGRGLSLCLGQGSATGSFWFDCRSCKRSAKLQDRGLDLVAAQAQNSVEAALPGIVAFEDHQFKINGDVPQNMTDALLHLYHSDASYADIPHEYLQYEVKDVAGDLGEEEEEAA